VDQGGGHVVEEVTVVDQQRQPPPFGPVHEGGGAAAEQVGAVVDRPRLVVGRREEGGESAERDARRALRGGDPLDGHPGRLGPFKAFRPEAGLADPGRAGQNDAYPALVREQRHEPTKIVGAADQRPITPHAVSLARAALSPIGGLLAYAVNPSGCSGKPVLLRPSARDEGNLDGETGTSSRRTVDFDRSAQ